MLKEQKAQLLNKLIENSKNVQTKNCSEPLFKDWRTLVERTLLNIYGESSIELREFKKLKFHNPGFADMLHNTIMPNVSQNVERFEKDFETAKRLIQQLIDDIQEDREEPEPIKANVDPGQKETVKELPKIQWQGTQKQLGELFIELKNKGWIDKIDKELITGYFTNATTISEVLKPAVDKGGEPTYEKIYTKAYKKSFDKIASNQRKEK